MLANYQYSLRWHYDKLHLQVGKRVPNTARPVWTGMISWRRSWWVLQSGISFTTVAMSQTFVVVRLHQYLQQVQHQSVLSARASVLCRPVAKTVSRFWRLPIPQTKLTVDQCCFLITLVFSARCVHYNESSRYCHDVRPPVCPTSGTCLHCDRTVHFGADLSLWLDSPMFWSLWYQTMSTDSQPSFLTSTLKRGGA